MGSKMGVNTGAGAECGGGECEATALVGMGPGDCKPHSRPSPAYNTHRVHHWLYSALHDFCPETYQRCSPYRKLGLAALVDVSWGRESFGLPSTIITSRRSCSVMCRSERHIIMYLA
jgi:hypothetical protein